MNKTRPGVCLLARPGDPHAARVGGPRGFQLGARISCALPPRGQMRLLEGPGHLSLPLALKFHEPVKRIPTVHILEI